MKPSLRPLCRELPPAPDPAPVAVGRSRDGQALIGRAREGSTVFTYALGDWRAWARHHPETELGDSVRIAEQEMPPETFDMFGFAEPGPRGERVLVTVSAYAMLTTVSVVSVLDPASLHFEAVDEPALGAAATCTAALQHAAVRRLSGHAEPGR